MPSEPITISRSTSLNGISDSSQIAAAVGHHGFHDVSDERFVLRPLGLKPGRFVAAPDHDVGGLLDLFHLVAVDDLLVAGEVNGARSVRAEALADGEQNGVAKSAASQQHGFLCGSFGGRAGWPHQDHGLARFEQRAEIGRAAHFEHDGREQPFLAIHRAPVSARPSMASVVPFARGASVSKFCRR